MKLSHRHFFPLFIFLCLLTESLSSFSVPTLTPQEEALEIAKKDLPLEGRLEQAPDGYVYLKVPDYYVYRLFPLVKEPGFEIPGALQRHTKIGAHISVIYKNESRSIGPIAQIGSFYSFEPKGIRIVRSGHKKYLILEVKSAALEKLRVSYNLSPLLLQHEFHITLAEQELHRHSTL